MKKTDNCTAYIGSVCVPNPGGKGGYGIVLKHGNQPPVLLNGGRGRTTANRVLLLSAIEVLKELDREVSLQICCRSEYVIQTVNSGKERKTNTDLWDIIDRISSNRNIKWRYPKDEIDNEYLEKCSVLIDEFLRERGEVIFDGGYTGEAAGKDNWRIKSSFAITDCTERLENERLDQIFGADRNLSAQTAAMIRTFNQKPNKKFKDFAALRTGGKDFWSCKSMKYFGEQFGQVFVDKMRTYIGNEKDLCSFFRWHCRGLTMTDAIQKVKTDTQIRSNADANLLC